MISAMTIEASSVSTLPYGQVIVAFVPEKLAAVQKEGRRIRTTERAESAQPFNPSL